MWLLSVSIALGLAVGYFGLVPPAVSRATKTITLVGLFVLLLAMGAQIGADPGILANLERLGFQAAVMAAAAVTGSVILVWLAQGYINHDASNTTSSQAKVEAAQSGNLTWFIVGSVGLGIGVGYLLLPEAWAGVLDTVTTAAISILLLGIGLDLGESRETWQKLRRMRWRVFLVPLLVAVGSLAGTILAGLVINLPTNESSAVGAGFGWYSLSGVLLAKIYQVETGALAFLTNVIRELLAILLIPLLARRIGKVVAVAPGGATTMDVTLPLIARVTDTETTLVAFVNGVVLSLLVPVLVPLLIRL
jgi:uncharacterized membrane protein YbjE (DUF340 family)